MNLWKGNIRTLYLQAVIIIFLVNIKKSYSSCYFSPELQGTFVTQGAVVSANNIQYSRINITEDAIPIWGVCHRRINNNVILISVSDETTSYRCFNLKLVARNILRVCTTDKDYIWKSYANEMKALASCPTDNQLSDPSKYTETILYKSLDNDLQTVRKQYCPINGRYKLAYSNDDGESHPMECSSLESELDNCPSGSAMNLRFKNCTFENHEITFECLGHWEGADKRKYLALMNVRTGKETLGPKYRCATYHENSKTGIINLSFSKDSTCSAINKFKNENKVEIPHSETLTLYPNESNVWPANTNFCQYPEWMQGHWEHITVKNDTLIYRDQISFKSYTFKCVENSTDGIFSVYSRTQCKEESYYCIKVKYRSQNIIEFQIGEQNVYMCNNSNFKDDHWLTQGRIDSQYEYSPCPVSGKFIGNIPDGPTLCAKLSSECSSEDIMYYEVSACDMGEVYEERKYRCLGQWEENGLIYTYTKRLDVSTYECFVGSSISDKEIFIKEAGEHCGRHMDPLRHGMQLNKIEPCSKPTTKFIHSNQRNQKANINSQIDSNDSDITNGSIEQIYPPNDPPSHVTTTTNSQDFQMINSNNDLPSNNSEHHAIFELEKDQMNQHNFIESSVENNSTIEINYHYDATSSNGQHRSDDVITTKPKDTFNTNNSDSVISQPKSDENIKYSGTDNLYSKQNIFKCNFILLSIYWLC